MNFAACAATKTGAGIWSRKKKKKKRRDPGPILAKAEYRFDQSLATGSLQNNGWADELSRKRWATDSNVFLLELRRVDDWL